MPRMIVRGVDLNYEIVGGEGPWLALMPGGRRSMEAVRSLAGRMAEAGYRVVIHDRRNCGASALAIDGANSEYEQWADDLHALLDALGALPVDRRRLVVGLPDRDPVLPAPPRFGAGDAALAGHRR